MPLSTAGQNKCLFCRNSYLGIQADYCGASASQDRSLKGKRKGRELQALEITFFEYRKGEGGRERDRERERESVCVCVCVCERERERERERGEKEREMRMRGSLGEVLTRGFISVIQPDFEYAASTFVPTMSAAQKIRLLGLWRKAIRCTAGATWQCEVGLLLVELRLSNIEHRWALQLALMVQKCHLGTAPQDICKKLNRTNYSHETRGNQSSFTPFRPLTTSGSVCFSNRAPLIWNFLPQPIRTCTSYTSFKSHFLDFI